MSPAKKLWIAIALIVFQLVTAGNALAMPISQAPVDPAPATMRDCPEHSAHHHQAANAVNPPAANSVSDHGGAEQKDCCKYGGCECPCLHGGVADLAHVEPVVLFAEVTPVISPTPDRLHSRPYLLFRPPA